LRRPVAGVLHYRAGDGLYLSLVDMETGRYASPVEIATVPALSGISIVDVAEGFVVAWGEWSSDRDRIVIVPIAVDGWDAYLFTQIVIYDEPHDPRFAELGGPSLAYDGRSPFIAYSQRVEGTDQHQVHLQMLDCNR